ncbi:MAG TPA: peptide ABC transporter substrate-binding protein [Candidatus Faecaligallichristensenella faecipullorum]|nr:peptide ABC transporter substrate-binding protein [Candidatus Faecaligallichristensenella faecipullorum]
MRKLLAMTLAVLMLVMAMPMLASAEATEQKLVFQMGEEPQVMDPTMNDYASGSYALQNLFRGLYKFAEDGSLVPAMAESYTVSEDGTVYTFTLREGLKWSDGSPLTAKDFEYSWKRVLTPELASETAYTLYGVIKNGYEAFVEQSCSVDEVGVKALDDLTLEVTLTAPAPYFLSMTASTAFMPVQQATIEANGEDWETDPSTFVCNGPFMVQEMLADEKYVFVKNPNYYDADNVKLDVLEYVFLNAPETVLIAFQNGEVDVATSVNADAIEQYNGSDNMLVSDRIGWRYYEINTTAEGLTDPQVRRALAMSLDRNVLITAVLQDNMPALKGFIPHGFPDLLDDTKSWRDTHEDVITEDVAAAQALMAEAGYPNGEGFPTIRLVQEPTASLVKVAQAMAQMWKQNLGINVEIVTVESGVYWADDTGTRDSGDFEIAYMGYTGDYLDPSSILYNLDSNGSAKNTRWSNEEYDDLMNQLRNGVAGEEREKVLERAEELLAEEMPVIPVYSYTAQALVSDRVHGFTRNYIGHPNFEYCYVD